MFAVGGGGEEAVDDLVVGSGRGVPDEGLHVGGMGRQADEVEVDAADERGFFCGGVRAHALGLEFSEDEVVDGVFDPRGILDGRERGLFNGLEGPVILTHAGVRGRVAGGDVDARVGGAAADPLGEIGDLLVGEFFAFGGHLEVFVFVADGPDEERLVGFTGDDRGAGVAAGEDGFSAIE